MPSETPAAPSASAAAIPRPSMMPPDATTGTSRPTASTTCGTSASVPTSGTLRTGSSPVKALRCPPASVPWAISPAAPAATARRASATFVTIASSGTPAARASGIAGVGSSKVVITDAPAATLASSTSIGVPAGGGGGGSGGRPSSARNGASTAGCAPGRRSARCGRRAGR